VADPSAPPAPPDPGRRRLLRRTAAWVPAVLVVPTVMAAAIGVSRPAVEAE
jgi:hypothetical protein